MFLLDDLGSTKHEEDDKEANDPAVQQLHKAIEACARVWRKSSESTSSGYCSPTKEQHREISRKMRRGRKGGKKRAKTTWRPVATPVSGPTVKRSDQCLDVGGFDVYLGGPSGGKVHER